MQSNIEETIRLNIYGKLIAFTIPNLNGYISRFLFGIKLQQESFELKIKAYFN